MESHEKGKTTPNKDVVIRCRVTSGFNEKLEKYCEEKNVTKSEVIITGIEKVINE